MFKYSAKSLKLYVCQDQGCLSMVFWCITPYNMVVTNVLVKPTRSSVHLKIL